MVTKMVTKRRAMLEQFLHEHPEDAFARYGLAMEMKNQGEVEAALGELAQLAERHPNYTAAYQQAGQILVALERRIEAKAVLERGLTSARLGRDSHAASEIEGLLEQLGD